MSIFINTEPGTRVFHPIGGLGTLKFRDIANNDWVFVLFDKTKNKKARLVKRFELTEVKDMLEPTKNEKIFRPEYIDIICLIMLLLVFFTALFLTHGIFFIIDLLLLAGTGAILGRTVGKMVTIGNST